MIPTTEDDEPVELPRASYTQSHRFSEDKEGVFPYNRRDERSQRANTPGPQLGGEPGVPRARRVARRIRAWQSDHRMVPRSYGSRWATRAGRVSQVKHHGRVSDRATA